MAMSLTKKLVSYDTTFLAVGSEDPATPNHALRLSVMKSLVFGASPWDAFITRDYEAQGYTEATDQATYNNRMSALLTVIVNAGG